MEALNAQVSAMSDEMVLLRAEIIQVKSAHATLHQAAADAGTHNARQFGEQVDRIAKMEQYSQVLVSTSKYS